MQKEIKLGFSNEQKLFRAYVAILEPIFKLRNREADVFSQLLFLNYQKRDIKDLNDRFDLIFSTKVKKTILENLNIKDSILQNTLSILRKKQLIVDNKIPTKFHVYLTDNKLELTFKFNIKNNEG